MADGLTQSLVRGQPGTRLLDVMHDSGHTHRPVLSIIKGDFGFDIPAQDARRVRNDTDVVDQRLARSHHLLILVAVTNCHLVCEKVIVGLSQYLDFLGEPQHVEQRPIDVDEAALFVLGEKIGGREMIDQRQQWQGTIDPRKKMILLCLEQARQVVHVR